MMRLAPANECFSFRPSLKLNVLVENFERQEPQELRGEAVGDLSHNFGFESVSNLDAAPTGIFARVLSAASLREISQS